ncbi:SgcJ/EcaC family oxidoreductase [Nonomuraea monospora]|uniref:SgcJ/EcaC family oxidoreductase n=1 Tax=Nonomuraea monospora TaxID=568818 RepID=A0ABN3CWV8_9ACTN
MSDLTELLDSLVEAWNGGDAAAYAAVFTDDADYITFDGTHLRGRAAIESSHRWLFDGPLKGSTMSGVGDAMIKPLADGAALVIAGGGTAVDGRHRPSVVTFTAVRTPEGWRFASFQNTRVAAR